MMEDTLDPRDIERAKTFWAEKDVDQAFSCVFEYLDHLKKVLQRKTATDKEYVQSMLLLESLDCSSFEDHQDQDSSVVQVVIGSGELLPANSTASSPSTSPTPTQLFNGPNISVLPAGKEELLPPLLPVQLEYHPHRCCKACLPNLPRMSQSTYSMCGQNPLKVPLLCGFKRLTAMPMVPSFGDGDWLEENRGDWDVIYKAPCGQSLRNYDDVMCFLSVTESFDVLQVDFFTFNHLVQLAPPLASGQHRSEEDLSRGAEPTPVELCVGDSGARPSDFRYRRDRWPHGCFLSRGPRLFRVCCDCDDGCRDAERCACIAMVKGGQGYSHHRLPAPVPSGLYECGPWCGCDRSHCQNRLVQRGIRVRLQVFQTEDRGWGVRCCDDLDCGTFVCIYAGVVLQRVQSSVELPPPKLFAADQPSDDEVEVVTEWRAPLVLEGRSNLVETPPPVLAPTSPPLYVPVIQRPAESSDKPQDQDQVKTVLVGGPDLKSPSAGDMPEVKVAVTKEEQEVSSSKAGVRKSLKRRAEVEDVWLVDARKEGNVSRFINHSCQPNLFIQNVFTDSHDPAFPVIAFFTDRVVKAGAELTWNYSAHVPAASEQKQEVPCLCRSDSCGGWLHIQEKLCDVCDTEGAVTMETT